MIQSRIMQRVIAGALFIGLYTLLNALGVLPDGQPADLFVTALIFAVLMVIVVPALSRREPEKEPTFAEAVAALPKHHPLAIRVAERERAERDSTSATKRL